MTVDDISDRLAWAGLISLGLLIFGILLAFFGINSIAVATVGFLLLSGGLIGFALVVRKAEQRRRRAGPV
jgi:multisubunit Na+/H+ antiporter MnhB subunit